MKRITIKDIAQEAGMSIASVSRALASFEEDYPGMTLEVYDINANDMSAKLSTEYNSGIRTADVILRCLSRPWNGLWR